MRSLLVLACGGCVRAAPVAAATVPTPVVDETVDPYQAAVQDAMEALPTEVVDDLLTLTPDTPGVVFRDGRVLVTTWERSSTYDGSYVAGLEFQLPIESWFVAGTELSERCAGLSGDPLSRRLEQILGLPAHDGRDVFVQVWIDPDALFRPCAQPDVTLPTCPIAHPMQRDGEKTLWACEPEEGDAHARWLCANRAASFSAADVGDRFPWTALGYTYDWGRPDDPVGATEFVASEGTPVVLHAVLPSDRYCNRD